RGSHEVPSRCARHSPSRGRSLKDSKPRTRRADAALVAVNVAFDVLRGAGKFTVSPTGAIVYLEGEIPTRRLEWVDRSGRSLGQIGEPNSYRSPRLSPDDSRLSAGVQRPDGTIELWVFDTARGLGSKIDEDI